MEIRTFSRESHFGKGQRERERGKERETERERVRGREGERGRGRERERERERGVLHMGGREVGEYTVNGTCCSVEDSQR